MKHQIKKGSKWRRKSIYDNNVVHKATVLSYCKDTVKVIISYGDNRTDVERLLSIEYFLSEFTPITKLDKLLSEAYEN